MATSALRAAVEGRVQANWTATPVAYDGANFAVPATAWIKVAIADNKTVLTELGSGVKRRRSYGVIYGDIFAPRGKGSNEARTLADTFATLFRDFKSADLTCDEPTVHPVGEKDGWYQLLVGVPYRYDFFI